MNIGVSPSASEISASDEAHHLHLTAQVRGRGALRFITCGSVDDGKSTLIGRLLHEARAIFEDQHEALAADSKKFGTTGEEIDYALLVDGLEAEREQGITIDVAYRFFSTPRRAFIVADTPGHAQYTRNMATGASGADLAILLIDARKGLLEQTRRHAAIVSLLGIHHVILAINKMDLVDYDRAVYEKIVSDFEAFAKPLQFLSVAAIPISARRGDNVVEHSARTPWYDGSPLLNYLEEIQVETDADKRPFRFPVQWVNRPNSDFRGYAGTVVSGHIDVGDEIVVAASGRQSIVDQIVTMDGDLETAHTGQAVTLVLRDHIDVGRGDIIASPRYRPDVTRLFSANIVWMAQKPATPGAKYLLKSAARTVEARIVKIEYRTDVATLGRARANSFELNDIGLAHIETVTPIAFDAYADNRATGAFILIDPTTHATAGAGMIAAALGAARDVHAHYHDIDPAARAMLKNQTPLTIWFTGLSGSGKSTIANLLEQRMYSQGLHTMLLDGDNLRQGLNADLDFTPEARAENVRRFGEVARLMNDAGLIVLCALVSPFAKDREKVAGSFPKGRFIEVYVKAPLELCRERDPKGLYARAADGKVAHMTGVAQSYEPPSAPDIEIDTSSLTAEQAADQIMAFLKDKVHASVGTSLDAAQL